MYNMHLVVFFCAKEQQRLADMPCAKNKLHCEIFTVDLVMTQQCLPHLSSSCLLKSLQKLLRTKDAILYCTVCDPRVKIHPSGNLIQVTSVLCVFCGWITVVNTISDRHGAITQQCISGGTISQLKFFKGKASCLASVKEKSLYFQNWKWIYQFVAIHQH